MTRPTKGRKRRGRGEGGVHFREDRQLWEGSISFGYDGQGKRNRKRVFADSKQGVLDEIARLRAEARAGTLPDTGKLTTGQLLDRWLASSKPQTAPRTYEEREAVIRTHVKSRLGGTPLGRLTALHVEGFYADMARDKVGPSAARHAAAALVAALNYARRLRLVPFNPAEGVPMPPEPRREMLCLDRAQVRILLDAARPWACYPLLTLALGAGLRQGELLGLTWPDLDLDARTVRVRRALSWTRSDGFMIKEPKSKAAVRTVKIPPAAAVVLAEHRKKQLAAGLIRAPIFCTASGGYLSNRNVLRSLKSIIDRVNDPGRNWKGGRPKKDAPKPEPRERLAILPDGLRFHDLRHTVASILLSGGESLRAVSQMLGHANPALTLRVYAHCLPGDDEKLCAALERVIG